MTHVPTDVGAKPVPAGEARRDVKQSFSEDIPDVLLVPRHQRASQKEYVGLQTLVERSVARCRPMMDTFMHSLSVTAPTSDATIFVDPLEIEQSIQIVLNNASNYTPVGGKIECTAESHGNRAIVTIRDNGAGIDQKMLARIFEPVAHTAFSNDRTVSGLALAKELVEQNDGSITALSAGIGRGSTFVIQFQSVPAATTASSLQTSLFGE